MFEKFYNRLLSVEVCRYNWFDAYILNFA